MHICMHVFAYRQALACGETSVNVVDTTLKFVPQGANVFLDAGVLRACSGTRKQVFEHVQLLKQRVHLCAVCVCVCVRVCVCAFMRVCALEGGGRLAFGIRVCVCARARSVYIRQCLSHQ